MNINLIVDFLLACLYTISLFLLLYRLLPQSFCILERKPMPHLFPPCLRNAGKTQEGYDAFMDKTYDTYMQASTAGGATWDAVQRAALDYWSSTKARTKQTANTVTDAAWRTWVHGVAHRGGDFGDVEDAARARWEATKDATKQGYDGYLAQTRSLFEQAALKRSWWDNVTDAWQSVKHSIHIGGPVGSPFSVVS
jgi:hypothetical protein